MRRWRYVCLLLFLCFFSFGGHYEGCDDTYSYDFTIQLSDASQCGGTWSTEDYTIGYSDFTVLEDGSSTIFLSMGSCRSFDVAIDTEHKTITWSVVNNTQIVVTAGQSRFQVNNDDGILILTFYLDCSGAYSETCEQATPTPTPTPDSQGTSSEGTTLIDNGECVDETDIECFDKDDVYTTTTTAATSVPGPACILSGQPSGGNPANCCSGGETSGICW